MNFFHVGRSKKVNAVQNMEDKKHVEQTKGPEGIQRDDKDVCSCDCADAMRSRIVKPNVGFSPEIPDDIITDCDADVDVDCDCDCDGGSSDKFNPADERLGLIECAYGVAGQLIESNFLVIHEMVDQAEQYFARQAETLDTEELKDIIAKERKEYNELRKSNDEVRDKCLYKQVKIHMYTKELEQRSLPGNNEPDCDSF